MAYTLLVVALFLYRHLAGGVLFARVILFSILVKGGRSRLHLRQVFPEGLQSCILLPDSTGELGDLSVTAADVGLQDAV